MLGGAEEQVNVKKNKMRAAKERFGASEAARSKEEQGQN
jgi:hypothetical protein